MPEARPPYPWSFMPQLIRPVGLELTRLVLIAVALAAIGGCLMFLRRRDRAPLDVALHRAVLDALLVLSILVILVVTLVPQPGLGGRRVSLVPFREIRQAISEGTVAGTGLLAVLGNVLVFVPFGFVASTRWPSLARLSSIAVAAALFSISLEVAQYFMGGRSSSIDDVLLNTAGATLGALAAWALRELHAGRDPG